MLTNFFLTGKLDFKSFITVIEQQLARLAAQQFVVNIVGNVSGTGGAASGAVQGGTSALMSGAGNFLGLGTAGSALSAGATGAEIAMAGGTTFGTVGAAGGFGAAIGTGATGAAGAAGSIAAGAEVAMAAIPVAGWVALAAVALYSIFGGKGGGPKVTSGFGPDIPATDMGDPSKAKAAVDTLNTAYAQLAHTIGLADDKLNASVLISTDPQGTAQTILEVASASANYSRSARLGGVENVGRSDADLQAALSEETTRLMFAALKQSNLSDLYRSWLDAVGANAGVADMQAAIDHISKAATEKQQLEAQLYDVTATDAEKLAKTRDAERASVDDSNKALLEQVYAQQDLTTATQAASQSLGDLFGGWQSAQAAASAAMPGILNALNDLAAARDNETKGLTDQMLVRSEAASQAIADANDAARLTDMLQQQDDAYRQIVQDGVDAAQKQRDALAGIFDVLKTGIAKLLGQVGNGNALAKDGMRYIDAWTILAGKAGLMPNKDRLQSAIDNTSGALTANNYATQFDLDRDRLVLAGKLAIISDATGKQLTTADLTLKANQDMLKELQSIDAKTGGHGVGVGGTSSALSDALNARTNALLAQSSLIVAGLAAPSSILSVPGFASGGYHAGGWAMVGESGPELAHFDQPARIYSASQTAAMGGGDDTMLQAICDRLDRIEANTGKSVSHVKKTADILSRVTLDGNSLQTVAA
jgi:hypothetical protein